MQTSFFHKKLLLLITMGIVLLYYEDDMKSEPETPKMKVLKQLASFSMKDSRASNVLYSGSGNHMRERLSPVLLISLYEGTLIFAS